MQTKNDGLLKRLEILRRKLEDEGRYVSAATVSLAVDEIKFLSEKVRNSDR